jgi:hypothetical protein
MATADCIVVQYALPVSLPSAHQTYHTAVRVCILKVQVYDVQVYSRSIVRMKEMVEKKKKKKKRQGREAK